MGLRLWPWGRLQTIIHFSGFWRGVYQFLSRWAPGVKNLQKGQAPRRMSLRPAPTGLIGGETVEQAGAAGADQVVLAAAAGRVCRIPRRIAATGAIEVAELGGAIAA